MQLVQAFFREAPNRVQLYDYDVRTDGQPVYIGHAPVGTAENGGIWVLFKFTYNDDNMVTKIESVGEGVWAVRDEYFT